MARGAARPVEGCLCDGEPRPALPQPSRARRAVARSRHRSSPRQRLRRVRGMVDRHPRARGDRAAQARPADRARDRLGRQEHPRPAHAQRGPPARAWRAAQAAPPADRPGRPGDDRGRRGGEIGRAGHHGAQHRQALRRQGRRQGFLHAHLPQGQDRRDRPERRGQDDLAQDADRRTRTRLGLRQARRQPPGGDDRPAPHRARSRQDAVGDPRGSQRPRAGARPAAPRHDLPARIPVPRRAGPPAGAHLVGRRAQPPAARQGAGRALEPAGARRADQRPRRRHARSPAGRARRL